jgi:hypothetical protein
MAWRGHCPSRLAHRCRRGHRRAIRRYPLGLRPLSRPPQFYRPAAAAHRDAGTIDGVLNFIPTEFTPILVRCPVINFAALR